MVPNQYAEPRGLLLLHTTKPSTTIKNAYDPTYSDLLSGQRINRQYSPLNIEIDGFRGSISSKGTKVFDLEIDSLGGIWIRGEWGPDIKKAQGETSKELHERYGHISYDTLKTLPEYPKAAGKPPRREACEKGKVTKLSSPKSQIGPIRTKQPLERLHCDMVGPTKLPTPGKQHQYLLVVTDDYTRYMSAKPLRIKDETANALVEIVNILEKAPMPSTVSNSYRQTGEANSATKTFRPNYGKEGSNSRKQYLSIAKPMWWQKEPTVPFLL